MSILHATVRDGLVVADEIVPFTEGTRLVIIPESEIEPACEANWDDSPEAIEARLKWLDSFEPLEFTPEERTARDQAFADQKKWELEQFFNRAERLEKLWQ